MKSRIYHGEIMHARLGATKNAFVYPVYLYAIDLDELPILDQKHSLFGYNKFSPISIHDADYLDRNTTSIKERLLNFLAEKGCDDDIARVELVTAARFFNYVFNPVSFYYCYRPDESIRCIVAEVNNTFEERHLYVLDQPIDSNKGVLHYLADKQFYVSPFYHVDGQYDFHFAPLNGSLNIRLDVLHNQQPSFKTHLRGKSIPMNNRNLASVMIRYPLRAWMTMPRILWQAAKLYYVKHVPIVHKPVPTHVDTIRVAQATRTQLMYKKIVDQYFKKFNQHRLIVQLPNGTTEVYGDTNSTESVELIIQDYNFYRRLALSGDVGFGEAYVAKEWDSPSVTKVLETMIDNYSALNHFHVHSAWLGRLSNKILNLTRRNTRQGSKKNIAAHYDLSNDFYQTFLDPTMMYSCALFKNNADTLETAQHNKLQALIQKAKITSQDHVLEIGTGWGGFALEAVQTTGCKVTTVTLSKEQKKFAEDRIAQAGMEDRIEVRLCDYRELEGQYDKIVSIEMIEAVGHEYLGTFFNQCDRLLKPDGLCVIQAITIPDQRYDAYRKDGDWIQKYIFPGAVVPSLTALCNAMTNHSSFMIDRLDNIGIHYARTLKEWRESIQHNQEKILELGFDQNFLRQWNYYLMYCEAGFTKRILNNLHLVLTRPNNPNA